MPGDRTSSREREPMIRIGMTLQEVSAVLGPPDRTTSGGELLGGAGRVVGGSPEMRSTLFFTKYCAWYRSEGDYFLTFEHERLTSVHGAPPGSVGDAPMSGSSLPSRLVWIVFAGPSSDPEFVVGKLVENGQLRLAASAIVSSSVDRQLALDEPIESEGLIARAIAFALRSLEVQGRKKAFLDLESMRVDRMRPARGDGEAFLLVTIAGPEHDPDAAVEGEFRRPRRRNVCGRCGISEAARLSQWNAPAPPGVVKIGDGHGAFMYCPSCEEGICGACSIDLGMAAGCPACRAELVYMDGTRQA